MEFRNDYILCFIYNPINLISQAIGFFCYLRILEFNFNASLWLQSSDELIEDLTLRKAIDLHCQGYENGDIFKDRIMLPEIYPSILEATVSVGGRKVLFHDRTKCWSSQLCGYIPTLIIRAESKQGFGT
jgi:hypothetical protein